MRVFVTGGAGFIGSHTCVELLQSGHDVAVFDNFCNSSPKALKRIEIICGKSPLVFTGDIRDKTAISDALTKYKPDAVMHFAGLKAVGESVEKPLLYYDNNVSGSLCLFTAMNEAGVKKIVFSSSATVYGNPVSLPIAETHRTSPANPYGETKLAIENILKSVAASDAGWSVGILRYFNPVGAHESGVIGENPKGAPNNLFPYISQVAVGRRELLNIWGDDYETPDGTGVRDYIHVVDLAKGHLAALNRIFKNNGAFTVNLGTGKGYSVLESVKAFEIACGKSIPLKRASRRAGDVAVCFADVGEAKKLLGWRAEKSLDEMCFDCWRWQTKNPNGYE